MKEHKAETPSAILKWWPELEKLFEHANITGIRIVCQKDDKTAAFQFGDVHSEAVSIISSLLGWKPDDLSEDEMPSEWTEAEEFLTRVRKASK